METRVINFDELDKYPLLDRFWNEYYNKAVDFAFKENKLALCDIYYCNKIPAYFVRDDSENKIGVIVELRLNDKRLLLVPNDLKGKPQDANEYFKNGFNNLGYHIFKLEIKLDEESYLQQSIGNQNYRTYLGKDPNYWAIIEDKNSGEKLYISFPNLSPIKIIKNKNS